MTDGEATVAGWCAPGFEAVRDALASQLGEPDELGAAVHVIIDGEVVADLWGGWADLARTRRWQQDTLVNAYSVGKPFVALLLLRLVDEGAVGLDDPVAGHWPAFGAAGKERVTVRQALCHQAGVPAIREPLTNDALWDFHRMCDALAATEPWWPPGTRHAYHTNTYGHLIGGLLYHVTGELPGSLLRSVCDPLEADVHFGLPDTEHRRGAEIHFDMGRALGRQPAGSTGPGEPAPAPEPAIDPFASGLDADTQMSLLGYANPPGYSSLGVVNTPQWRRAQVPSTNGHMTAAGIARLYDAIVGGQLLTKELLAEATRSQSTGFCPTLGQDVAFGLGFQPWTPSRPFGRNPGGFGHFGSGGSLGFADPAERLAVGYVINHVIPRWQSPYNRAIVDAVYGSLTARREI